MILEQISYGLAIGSVYGLIAIGFSLVFKAAGLLNFAHQDFMMVGALIGLTLAQKLGLPLLSIIGVTFLTVGAVAVIVEKVGLAPIRARKGAPENLIISTLGWSIVLGNVARFLWGAWPRNYPATVQRAPVKIAGIAISPLYMAIFGLGIGAMVLLTLFFRNTKTGQALRAAAEDPSTAELMGIRVNRTISLTFFISGGFGGMAGVLIGTLFYASFDLGIIGLKAIAAAVLGGFGNVVGAMLGGLILGIAESLGGTYISGAYKEMIGYGILILFLLLRPQGIWGESRQTSGLA